MKKSNLILSSVIGGVVGAFALYAAALIFQRNQPTDVQRAKTLEEKQNIVLAKSNGIATGIDFKQAAAATTPAVVHIKTFANQSVRRNQYQLHMDDFFNDFFGGPRYRQPLNQGPQPLGSGSGVILTSDGYIATNNHVIEGADKIEVVLNDKRTFVAELIGTDPSTDLALLKVEDEDLPFIRYGNSDEIEVGEWVLAVGNPFDLTSTVTAGIVSAKARNINILKSKERLAIESFIQTDAAVNPGNSGGALVNTKGELVGINTAIASPTGAYTGYSFAVPVSLVKKVMEDLNTYGQVQRALLGISIQDIDAELAEKMKLENLEGVYVAGVREDGAADLSGIKQGDVILEIDGETVNSSSELQEVVARYRPGDEVEVQINRNGKKKSLKAKLKNKLGTTAVVKKGETAIVQVAGMKLKQLTEEDLKKYNVPNGVQVQEVLADKLKGQKLKDGFIIVRVNKRAIETPEELAYLLEGNTGAILLEGVYPNGQRAYYIFGG